jgi:hypothetical protein
MWYWLLILFLYGVFGEEAGRDVEHRQRKRRIPRPQQESSIFHHSNTSYGYPLPSFSLDYSEYILGAIIERSSESRELYLAIFLLDLKLVSTTPSIIEAVSTEMATFESWTNAFKILSGAQSHQSGYVCNLHNNDPKHKVAYHSPAYKVQTSSNTSSFINIVRCRLHGADNIYSYLRMTNKSLHVDLLRRSSKHTLHNATAETTVDPRTWLLSFSVPWRTRMTGYGFQLNGQSSKIDPWQSLSPRDSSRQKYALCAGISQPLHPTRSSVPLPSLIEFIEHHLSPRIGHQHIFLSLLADQHSSELQRHLAILAPYIDAGLVTLTTVGYDGYDNVAGIANAGIVFKLSSDILRQIFTNQCLYFTKGIVEIIGIANPSDFLIPVSQPKMNIGFLNNLYMRQQQQQFRRSLVGHKKSISSHNQDNNAAVVIHHHKLHRVPRNISAYHSLKADRMQALPSHATIFQSCDLNASSTATSHPAYLLTYFGLTDPADSFGGWGPGESSWSRGELSCLTIAAAVNHHSVYLLV